MHPLTWKASGHIDNFSDPMIDNKDSKKRYRVDHLIEAFIDHLVNEENEILEQSVNEFPNTPGLSGNETESERLKIINEIFKNKGGGTRGIKALEIQQKMNALLITDDYIGLKKLIEDNNIKC